jgi:hypothetical protein
MVNRASLYTAVSPATGEVRPVSGYTVVGWTNSGVIVPVIDRVSEGVDPLAKLMVGLPALSGVRVTVFPLVVAETTVESLELTLNVSGTKVPAT